MMCTCEDCVHADKETMTCYPDSSDFKFRYYLDPRDFVEEAECDYYKKKGAKKNE